MYKVTLNWTQYNAAIEEFNLNLLWSNILHAWLCIINALGLKSKKKEGGKCTLLNNETMYKHREEREKEEHRRSTGR